MVTKNNKILGVIFLIAVSAIGSIRCNFEEKNVVQINENQTFVLTYGFQNNPNMHEQTIFEYHATKESDYLILNAHNITDFTHNPTVFVASSLKMLQSLFTHISKNPIPSNITYTNCTLSYSQSCFISDQSSKVKQGDTFYLIFVGVGANRHSQAEIRQEDYPQFQGNVKQVVVANANSEFTLINPSLQKEVILELSEKNIQQENKQGLVGEIEVFFLNAQGCLLGDDRQHSEQDEWHHSNKISLTVNNAEVSNDKEMFQGNLQQNRQFVIQFGLHEISSVPLGENRNVKVQIQNNYHNNKVIAIAYKYKVFQQNNRIETLTAPVITTLSKKNSHSQQYEALIHYQHPLFEYLASKDKENAMHSHFKPPKNQKFVLLFEIFDASQNKFTNMEHKIFYNNESLESDKPDEYYPRQSITKVDVNKITKVAEQTSDYKGIYLLLQLSNEFMEQAHEKDFYLIKSNLLTEKDFNSDTNSNNNNNNNNNNTNNNTNNNKGDKNDDTVLIIIVVVGIGFIITSTLVYVKCIQNRNSLEDPEQLEEVGEEMEKQNENHDDIEKANSSGNNSSGNTSKKPQSTKSSTKTNGNHIQLAQDDDKSGLDDFDHHNHSSERKSNNLNGDLSANNLNNDKNQLIAKKPPQRKKNIKNHLFIEIEENDSAKEQQAYLKAQQLKLLQQKALQQKQQQRQNNQSK